jgi:2-keto-4-pentenoate hydratase
VTLAIDVEHVAARLDEARRNRAVLPNAVGAFGADVAEAAAVQAGFVTRWTSDGAQVAGYKLGLTTDGARAAFGVSDPVCGVLLDEQILASDSEVTLAEAQPAAIEPELVFRADDDLTPGTSVDALRRRLAVTVGIEVPVHRVWDGPDCPIDLLALTADNVAAGFLVVADAWHSCAGLDVAACTVHLHVDGELAATGVGSNVLGDPLRAVVALVAHLARVDRRVRAGELVASGSLTPPQPAVTGVHEAIQPDLGRAALRVRREGHA